MLFNFRRSARVTERPQPVSSVVVRLRSSCLLASLAVALLVTSGQLATAQAQGPRNLVYVESNDPGGNAILAYTRGADGSLSPLPGSPFSTAGLGVTPTFDLGPYDSDQEIIVNPSHTLLFAVNGGSDTIAVFSIQGDGSLTPVPGSPFSSGGSNPVSLGLAGDILCVVNKDDDPNHPGKTLPNYTSFKVSPKGQLRPVPNSTLYDDLGSNPSQALISPSGRLLFGADFLGGLLRTLSIGEKGRLAPQAALALPPMEFAASGAPPLPLGLAVHPHRPFLYVGFVTINRVGVYRYTPIGGLHFLRSVADSGNGVCWLLVNKAGTRLYASNTGDPSISVFDIATDPSQPVEIQKIDLDVAPGSNPGGYQFALDPTESFLHVVTQQFSAMSTPEANALHVFSVGADGTLMEVPSSPTVLPVPNLVRPQGVAAL